MWPWRKHEPVLISIKLTLQVLNPQTFIYNVNVLTTDIKVDC